jgi:hypothetical protein
VVRAGLLLQQPNMKAYWQDKEMEPCLILQSITLFNVKLHHLDVMEDMLVKL